jgi:hypothetical protein
MTVWSDCVGYARFGVSMFGISPYLPHTLLFHWLIDALFAGLHVAMKAVRVILAVARIAMTLLSTLGNWLASPGSGRSLVG